MKDHSFWGPDDVNFSTRRYLYSKTVWAEASKFFMVETYNLVHLSMQLTSHEHLFEVI